jgi:glyoxylase-like metal-dependent hydrolase (beta-lactamase superfamily II)
VIHTSVADGVHRVEDAYVNWYAIEGDDGVTVVDAGFPSSWRSFEELLKRIGRRMEDVRAVVLTHGHFDHVGFAERARAELAIPVWVPDDDGWLARHPYRYETERPRILYLWKPPVLKIMATMAAAGALAVEGVWECERYQDGQELPVPGRPRVVGTPGHTFGHSSLVLADRGVVIAGDAVVTLDIYTAQKGPRVVARAATANSDRALASLDRIEELGDLLLLPGHGDPYPSAARAASLARAAGVP